MYKPGDVVLVKTDIDLNVPLYFDPKMKQYIGMIYKIKDVQPEHSNIYTLEDVYDHEDGYFWFWHESWLEPAEEHEFKINDSDFMSVWR